MIQRFKQIHPELNITDTEVDLVGIAGLCHDLGHGPFSHLFDSEFIKRARPELNWTHEDGSIMMLNDLIDENAIDIDRGQIRIIQDMISGEPQGLSQRRRGFLYQIVANHKNSVDVDKFDYLARDCYNVGLKSSYDSSRLLFSCRVVDDEVCFHSKEVHNIYEMFHTRYMLHRSVYSHRVVKAIEYMICDVLCQADRHLGISEAVNDPSRFVHLTDGILRTIEASTDPELEQARAIMHRIRKRDLYKFIDEVIIPPELIAGFPQVRPEDICAYQGIGNLLKPDDIIVQNLKVDYAMKDRNPVDNILFYTDPNQTTKAIKIPKQKVSSLIPDQFQERFVRVFCRMSLFCFICFDKFVDLP
jgi:HD superfamily phosphohydrolase